MNSLDNSSTISEFTNEINFSEIQLIEGGFVSGTYGRVKKGVWNGQVVAVKLFETEEEKINFNNELRQFSRVSHENIIRLYGASQDNVVALIMEYADGVNFYNVIHSQPLFPYTLRQLTSWVLQCARGVSYLHSMRPRELVHRELNPHNLLLVNGGTVLKICDFGCNIGTEMTNNKGSLRWIAPEVFKFNSYTEKCDVYSYGIILWEVLSRRKPYENLESIYSILFTVADGQRPPLLRNCPKVFKELMTTCWATDPNDRPSMTEVEQTVQSFSFSEEEANELITESNQTYINELN